MSLFTRTIQNPLIAPDPTNPWEAYATFNGCVTRTDDGLVMVYRAMGAEQIVGGKKLRLSTVGVASSSDGLTWSDRRLLIQPIETWEQFGCEDPRVTKMDGRYYIFYTALGSWPPNPATIRTAVAITRDFVTIEERHLVTPFNAKGMTLFPEKIDGKYTVLMTAHTDRPPSCIAIATLDHLYQLWDETFWQKWETGLDEHTVELKRLSSDQVEVGAPPVKTAKGWLLAFASIGQYFTNEKQFRIEAALLDLEHPQKVIATIEEPLLTPAAVYEQQGQITQVVFPSGLIMDENTTTLYYGGADSVCCSATIPTKTLLEAFDHSEPPVIKAKRFANNPLLSPIQDHDWESKAVFNPACVTIDGVIYIVYRTLSSKDVSSLGLAISSDGYYIDERLDEPIYVPRGPAEKTTLPNTGSGCEDPRITRMGDRLYLCYTAYDGKLPRLALSSISVQDFLDRNWNAWAIPKIISPPGIADKDGCLFPETIDGKYVFFHRVEPDILIDTVDSLGFDTKPTLACSGSIHPRQQSWDDVKIGINAPPLKTTNGWLVFYHGISKLDHAYRLGAFLLDLHDVTKVLARTRWPLLEPERYYEKEGIVPNVVFPCGSALQEDTILIYYGGADKHVCGATLSLRSLMGYFKRAEEVAGSGA